MLSQVRTHQVNNRKEAMGELINCDMCKMTAKLTTASRSVVCKFPSFILTLILNQIALNNAHV